MMPLQIFICAIICLSSALTIAVDVQELDNQILVTGEVTLPDCKLKDYTRWDKLMTMLENSHMRENMLLQYFEDLKVDLQNVKGDLSLLGANTSGSCSDCFKSFATDLSSLLDSKCQSNGNLITNQQKSIAPKLGTAGRLQSIENEEQSFDPNLDIADRLLGIEDEEQSFDPNPDEADRLQSIENGERSITPNGGTADRRQRIGNGEQSFDPNLGTADRRQRIENGERSIIPNGGTADRRQGIENGEQSITSNLGTAGRRQGIENGEQSITSNLGIAGRRQGIENEKKSIAPYLDIADRLQRIENLLKQREEADQNKSPCVDKGGSDPDSTDSTQKLDLLLEHFQKTQDWMSQRQLPSGCEAAILFPMRSPKIYASVHPAEMSLQAFTLCVWTKVTEALEKTIVISYGTKRNPYEIQLYLNGESPVLVVGGDNNKIAANNALHLGEWSHLCGTWSSEDGRATLWVNGENKIASELAQGHNIPGKGLLQLGQEKNGCCLGGGFDESLSFSGKLTGVNLWDSVLSEEDIVNTAGESGCNIRGNVVGWGITEIQPHGGAQYVY